MYLLICFCFPLNDIASTDKNTCITSVTLYLGNVFFLSWLPSFLPPSRPLPSSSRTPLLSNYPHTAPIISALPPSDGPCASALAGRQAVECLGKQRESWCVCQRDALPHSPGGWQCAGCGKGVRLFLTTSQVPQLIWELFISCQKTAFPLQLQERAREGKGARMGERGLHSESRAWYSNPCA